MLNHPTLSGSGQAARTWLLRPGPVCLRRFVKNSKFVPSVTEVSLLDGNAEYAHIRYPDARETTVSTRHLAPTGQSACEVAIIPINQADPIPEADESPTSDRLTPICELEDRNNPSPQSTPLKSIESSSEITPLEYGASSDYGESDSQTAEANQREPNIRRSFRPRTSPTYLSDYITS